MSSKHKPLSPPSSGGSNVDRDTVLSEGLDRLDGGDIDGAERIFRRVLKKNRGDADALHLLGLCQHQKGNNSSSIKSIKKAIAQAGPSSLFLNNLGQIQAKAGKPADAVKSFQIILKTEPGNFEVRTNLANGLVSLGRNDEAVRQYNSAIETNPSYAPAHFNLGTYYLNSDRADEAVPCFQKAVEIAPDYLFAHNNLGLALLALEQLEEAVTSFKNVLSIDKNNPDAFLNLGIAYLEMNDGEGALAYFDRALSIDPGFFDAHDNRGVALGSLGRLEEAAEAHRKAISLQPQNAKPYINLSILYKVSGDDRDISAMERLANDPIIAEDERMGLLFALARAYDHIGGPDKAFAYLKEANNRKRRTFDFDIAEQIALHDKIKRVFSGKFISSLADKGDKSEIPVFVVGLPRSGSTLIEQILASHPDIHGAGEHKGIVHIIDDLSHRSARELPFPQCVEAVPDGSWQDLGASYVAGVTAGAPKARRVIDKFLGNYQNLGLINLLLPNARIIHSHRDPISTCFSCYQTDFRYPVPYACDLVELGEFYRLYEDLMDHWRQVSALPILDLDYEKLVFDQKGETERLLAFCALDWDDACLNFHKTERTVRTASLSQVRQPIYTSAVKRWENYREHLNPLLDALGVSAGF